MASPAEAPVHPALNPARIQFECDDPEIGNWEYGYTPRVEWLNDRYCVTWYNGYHGPTIGVAWTKDSKAFHQLMDWLKGNSCS